MDDINLYAKGEQDIILLIWSTSLYSKDFEMSFRLGRCSRIEKKRRKVIHMEGIGVSEIRTADVEKSCKYRGIPHASYPKWNILAPRNDKLKEFLKQTEGKGNRRRKLKEQSWEEQTFAWNVPPTDSWSGWYDKILLMSREGRSEGHNESTDYVNPKRPKKHSSIWQ